MKRVELKEKRVDSKKRMEIKKRVETKKREEGAPPLSRF